MSVPTGLVILDLDEPSLPKIFNAIVEGLLNMKLIEPSNEDILMQMLYRNITVRRYEFQISVSYRGVASFPAVMVQSNIFFLKLVFDFESDRTYLKFQEVFLKC